MGPEPTHCLTISNPEHLAGGARPWSPGRREEDVDIERAAAAGPRQALVHVRGRHLLRPRRRRDGRHGTGRAHEDLRHRRARLHPPPAAGDPLHPQEGPHPHLPGLPDGRALTTAIIEPGTIFGEMVIVGQQMHDSFAEALDDVVVCVMTKADVRRLLLSDPRISARISETLGRRIGELEQRLSDAIFKSVPERIAGALVTLAEGHTSRTLGRGIQIKLTHEQLAALAGTSRETTTKILGDFADLGLVGLGRGRVNILDPQRLRRASES
ncbi:MAG: Crp/Fnr family transcriptional regulator [Nocardioidaceae bacterium]